MTIINKGGIMYARILVLVTALMFPASALGDSAQCQAYNAQAGCSTKMTGHLPFTGINLLALVAIGAAVLVVGVAVRRIERSSD